MQVVNTLDILVFCLDEVPTEGGQEAVTILSVLDGLKRACLPGHHIPVLLGCATAEVKEAAERLVGAGASPELLSVLRSFRVHVVTTSEVPAGLQWAARHMTLHPTYLQVDS